MVLSAVKLVTSGLSGPQLRAWFEKRGPVSVKLGQHLALRPDLISADVAQELLRLTDQVTPEPVPEIDQILLEDLGLTRVQLSLDAEPVASGSLAQIFAGRAPDGSKVAVKVKRPGIEKRVKSELDQLDFFSAILPLAGIPKEISAADVRAELRESLLRELDFNAELANLTRMHELAAGKFIMAFPKPYPELCSPRVITMEYFDGVPLSRIMARNRTDAAAEAQPFHVDCDAVAANLLWSCLDQLFNFETFHADMHPGNIIVLPDNRIGFVDLGLVGSLSRDFQAKLSGYLRSIHEDDLDRMIEGALRVLVETRDSNREGFRADLVEAHESWLRAQHDPGSRTRTGVYMVNVLAAARRNGFGVPKNILALYRSLCTAELIASEIAPETNLSTVGPAFFREQQVRSFLQVFDGDRLQTNARSVVELLLEGPGQFAQILSDIAENRFVLQVEERESPQVRNRRDLRTKLMAAAILAVALTLLLAVTMNGTDTWMRYATGVITVALIGVYGTVAVLWKRLR